MIKALTHNINLENIINDLKLILFLLVYNETTISLILIEK